MRMERAEDSTHGTLVLTRCSLSRRARARRRGREGEEADAPDGEEEDRIEQSRRA